MIGTGAELVQTVPMQLGILPVSDAPARAQVNLRGSSSASPSTTLPYGGAITLVSTLDQLSVLEAGWRKLEEGGQGVQSVFQTFDWIFSWCRVYLKGDNAPELMVLAGHQDGKLVFVLPLMISQTGPIRTLTWLTEPSGQYGDILLSPDQSATVWMAASISFLRQIKNVDLIRLRHVREDAKIHHHVSTRFNCARLFEQAPCLDLTQFGSAGDYESRYNSQQRKRRKKIRKSLEEIGAVEFQNLPPGILADTAMASAIAEKNEWLRARGRRNVILKCPRHMEFLKLLSRATNSAVETVTTQITAGGKPVSWEIGFRYNKTHFAYITSHLNTLTDLSPGRLHMDLSQRKALTDGMNTFDLMVPNDQHKESWSSKMVGARDFYLPLSLRGRMFGWLYLVQVRPLLRKAYYRLPRKWLLFAQKLIGR